jgi:hypothetical protein
MVLRAGTAWRRIRRHLAISLAHETALLGLSTAPALTSGQKQRHIMKLSSLPSCALYGLRDDACQGAFPEPFHMSAAWENVVWGRSLHGGLANASYLCGSRWGEDNSPDQMVKDAVPDPFAYLRTALSPLARGRIRCCTSFRLLHPASKCRVGNCRTNMLQGLSRVPVYHKAAV